MSDSAPQPLTDSSADLGAGSYHSLYRRYRPQRFSEVRGQDLVATTLRNAVRDERIVHAYLFSGPRGTGKTSTARILAKALNCTNLQDGEPCGTCDSCTDIVRGSSLDVHELDAASNNGVDAMRDLVARASLATPGNRKVYIIDEVHMLSTAASNALLKTLEEPPEHVVFVLATTDPQKVLPTIRSRTQHFEFHLLEQPVLEGLLTDIADAAGLELPEEGIEAAVRRGHGSARDALSVLDQVAASGVVEDDARYVHDLVAAIAEQDPSAGLNGVGGAITAGFDAHRLGVELVEALREQFLASVARRIVRPDAEVLGEDGRPILPPARCVRALELVGKALVDMREAIDPRTTLEVAIMRLTSPDVDDSTAALVDRIERLERRLADYENGSGPLQSSAGPGAATPARPPATANAAAATAPGPPPTTATASAPPPTAATAPQDQPPATPGARPALGAFTAASHAPQGSARPQAQAPTTPSSSSPPTTTPAMQAPTEDGPLPTRDDLVTAWADHILPSLKPRARALYAIGRWAALDGNEAVMALPNAAHVDHASPLRNDIAEAVSSHFNARLTVRLVAEAEAGDAAGDLSVRGPSGASTAPAAARDSSGSSAPGGTKAATFADEVDVDLAETEAAGPNDTASWAEHRVREAFPGIEEVTE